MAPTPLMGEERETGITSSPLFQEKSPQEELIKILSLASDSREREGFVGVWGWRREREGMMTE